MIELAKYRKEKLNKICFIHVPKCGGTSISDSLRKSKGIIGKITFRIYQIDAIGSRKKADKLGLGINDYRQSIINRKMTNPLLSLIMGHSRCEPWLREKFEKEWQFVTVLRHPVKRWLSNYYYNKYKKSRHFKHNMSLEEYIDDDMGKYSARLYLQLFSEKELEDDEKVLSSINNLSAFSFVGILEQPEELKKGFESVLGKRLTNFSHKRSNPHNYLKETISDTMYNRIEYLCRFDMKIYNHFLNKSKGS